MKRWKMGIVALFSAMLIAACGEADEDVSVEELDEGEAAEEEETQQEENLTAEDVLTQSMEAMNEVESYRIEMEIDQEMEIEEESIPINMTLQMDVIQEPMMFKQVMTTPDVMGEGPMEMEQYMDEDGKIYMYEPTAEQWFYFTPEALGITDINDIQMSPHEQLEMLESMTESIELTETDEYYELSVVGSGDGLKELAMQFASLDGGDSTFEAELDEVLAGMNIDTLDYVIKIDKETFYQTEIHMNMEMSMEAEGQTVVMNQVVKGTVSQYNEIDNIEIPEEAKDHAVDLEEEMMNELGE